MPRALRSLTRPFALLFLLLNFLRLPPPFHPSNATGPDKVAYPMLKHLPRSGMDFLLHIFNLSWTSHSFHLEDIFYYSHSQDSKAT